MIIGETKIGPNWEISIPLEMLRDLNIKEGDEIILIRENNEIILRKLT